MDEEKDEQPPFRWNRQAICMVAIFLVAMALPLGGVVWVARDYLSAQQRQAARAAAPAPVAVDAASLERGLERVAEAQFASAVSLQDVGAALTLTLAPDDMTARIARIGELAREAGGSALEVGEPGATPRRVRVQVAGSREELLKRAIRGERVDFSAIPAGTATQMLEVELRAP